METTCENLLSTTKFYFPLDSVSLACVHPNADQEKTKLRMANCPSLAPSVPYPGLLCQTFKVAARSSALRKKTLAAFRNQNTKYLSSSTLLDVRFLFGSVNKKNYFPHFLRVTYQIGQVFSVYLHFLPLNEKFYSSVVNGRTLESSPGSPKKYSNNSERILSRICAL